MGDSSGRSRFSPEMYGLWASGDDRAKDGGEKHQEPDQKARVSAIPICLSPQRPFGKLLDGGGIFGRRHASDLLKLAGKIVNRPITKLVCNLSEVILLIADQLFCMLNLHCIEFFQDAAAAMTAAPRAYASPTTATKQPEMKVNAILLQNFL